MINSQYFDSVPVKEVFKKGGFDTKLSFLIMGFSNFYHKQIIKGCLFLLSEILFLIAFVTSIIPSLQGLITLGTQEQGLVEKTVGGIKMKVAVEGDNSMLMLIFGLAALIFCLVFAYIYWCNLKSARNLYVLDKENKKIPTFKEDFETLEKVTVDIKPANSDVRLSPPTLLKNNWFSRPFRMFVEMYGVPKYNDADPTLLVALSYTLLFGIMFGDVGQGVILSLVGFVAYKKFGLQLGAVGVRLGISSMLFGVVFGSVFGNEEILIPLFNAMSPDNTMTLLIAAICLGIILIIISMAFNVILSFKKKNFGEAVLSQNGICGLVFYISILGLGFVNVIYVVGLIALPLFLIFLKEPLIRKFEEHEAMFPNGFGAFFVEGFFELFEVVLSFITNTMSFLRVGGFVLSHAGMMLVVYTLAEMVGGVGELAVIIFGNIFVMCLEGLIVGIQVLRLEFYEMFSRYYEGNGISFKTIKED